MRIIILFISLFFPLFACAQNEADALLDKVSKAIKADAALQMDYSYAVCDEEGTIVYSDEGTMKLDNDCYSLDMDNMKIWCNGETQWSYMKDIDEVYITDAASEEAQNLSPLYIMEAYRENYSITIEKPGKNLSLITMSANDVDAEVNKVELFIDSSLVRLTGMIIHLSGQGCIEVQLNNYKPKCKFDKNIYECPLDNFPGAEIVDMR